MTVPIDRWTVEFSNICRKAIMSEDMSDWSGSFRKNKEHQFEFQLQFKKFTSATGDSELQRLRTRVRMSGHPCYQDIRKILSDGSIEMKCV